MAGSLKATGKGPQYAERDELTIQRGLTGCVAA
jgi:hypothetical protein